MRVHRPKDDGLVKSVTKQDLQFTVDSRLLEELGERLVGKPSTALAELVKNAYDADARTCEITVDLEGAGRIMVADDGHGMTMDEFRQFWMRVGSQHKRDQRRSRKLKRLFTGSKGVGRIAAQVLSRSLRVITVAEQTPTKRLLAHLKWSEAIHTGDLTSVTVAVQEEELTQPQENGTTFILEHLQHSWSKEGIQELATEIWQLQSPFPRLVPGAEADFEVSLSIGDELLDQVFKEQMAAILRLWTAKAVGRVKNGTGTMSIQFRGGEPATFGERINLTKLKEARFELRFYDLQGRQPSGIRVQDARDYLKGFGGVHIYDTGFRLPFYGQKDNDWLLISYDMSRRVTVSELLPPDIQEPRMMLYLPQWNQVLGAVEIDTAVEPDLEVTITRDRLVDSGAFRELREFVRRAIHWYSNEKAKRRIAAELASGPAPMAVPVADFREVLREVRAHVPQELGRKLEDSFEATVSAGRSATGAAERRAAALAAFATAGIAAVGYHHELVKQFVLLERLADTLPTLATGDRGRTAKLEEVRSELHALVQRVREIGRVFSHLFEPENMEVVETSLVKPTVESIVRYVATLQPGVRFDLAGIDGDSRLPPASYSEWVSVFQNAFFNSFNALIDSEKKTIRVRTECEGGWRRVLVEDTGAGVDLADAEVLFEPFVRRLEISRERRELGFGGSGLGLTIMRLIADSRGIRVKFQEPPRGFSTSLVLEWTDTTKE